MASFSADDIFGSAAQAAPQETAAPKAFSADEIMSAPKPPPQAEGRFPGFFESMGIGAKRSLSDVKEAFGPEGDAASPEEQQVKQPYEWRDLYEPSRGLAKTAYGLAKSSPSLAGGIAGGFAGAATPVPGGAIAGGALGAGAGAMLQTIGPAFHDELKKSPDDPDGAYNRALEHSTVAGTFSAMGWAAFPAKFFQGPIKNAVFQAFGVQAPLATAERGVQNVISDKPITENMGQAYTSGAVGTLVPAIGHAAVSGTIRGRNPVEPDPRTPDQLQALKDADTKRQQAESLDQLADLPGQKSDDVAPIKQQANDLRDEADYHQFEANRSNLPIPQRGKVAQSFVDNVMPEMMSDKALQSDSTFARFKSASAQVKDAIVNAAEKWYYQWNKVPMNDRIDFITAYEKNDPAAMATLTSRYPWMGQRAVQFRDWLSSAYQMEEKYGSRADYLQNYFPHLWSNPTKAQELLPRIFGNELNPQTMGQGYQKARFYDDIQKGLAAGLELKYKNPEDMIAARLMSGADMQQKMKLLGELYGEGVAVPAERAPADISNPGRNPQNAWKSVRAPNGSQWFIAPDVQPLWKNAVEAKGLWANQNAIGGVFRGWMGLKNAWVPIKLGLSLFHPIHVWHINLSNNLVRGLRETFGPGEQGIGRRLAALPEAVGQSVYDTAMLGDAFLGKPIRWMTGSNIGMPHVGKEIGEAWKTLPQDQTARQKMLTDMMNDAGTSAQLSEQLKIQGKRAVWDALANDQKWKAAGSQVGRMIKNATGPIFEEWIPNLKRAAVSRETEAMLRRDPTLADDPQRLRIAMRTIGKQVDNRYGEMFYGGLFWNRTMKDAAIGSFLSLGWNLGFAREFVGGALEPSVRRLMDAPSPTKALIRNVSSKSANAFVYTATAMMTNAAIQKMLTGEDPKEWMDYIFPKIGGTNPDGSPRRISNPFYTREVVMAKKHIEERQSFVGGLGDMLMNKLMFQPFAEMATNRNYFGANIWDENAPAYKQVQQFGSHVLNEQLNPISIVGAKRALQLSGKPHDTFGDVVSQASDRDAWMPMLGFGPAPSYASRDEVQNRIGYLYNKYVAPEQRPYKESEELKKRGDLYNEYKQAIQTHDAERINEAAQKLAQAGVKSQTIKKVASGNISQYQFQRLGQVASSQQVDLLKQMNPDQFREYWKFASKKAKVDPEVLSLFKKYFGGSNGNGQLQQSP